MSFANALCTYHTVGPMKRVKSMINTKVLVEIFMLHCQITLSPPF